MRKSLHYLLALVLFGVFFASYTDLLSHVLYYNEQHQLFLYTADYYHSQTLTGWLTAFVVQFFYYPLLGAAVMSGLLTAIYLMSWRILTALTRREDILRHSLACPLGVDSRLVAYSVGCGVGIYSLSRSFRAGMFLGKRQDNQTISA